MRLTLINPCVGRRGGERYLRTWCMEPLPIAVLSALTPGGIDLRFYDDRLEAIPFDEPCDAVALTVETYTALRAYQIASEYRRRGVPVIMGGYHANLCPHEVARHADTCVCGDAEAIWPQLCADLLAGSLATRYDAGISGQPLAIHPDRRLLAAKRYLPVNLVEVGRGCHHACEFCSVQTAFARRRRLRPIELVLEEIRQLRHRSRYFFFIDDDLCGDRARIKEFLEGLIPLGIRWFGQASILCSDDRELMRLMALSGCATVLIGLESLDNRNLARMNKGFNADRSRIRSSLRRLQHCGIPVYGAFVFGYDHDTPASVASTVDFTIEAGCSLAAFAHLTPFPGTPLYRRLETEGRLLSPQWWLDPRYGYGNVTFQPHGMSPESLAWACRQARRRFYSPSSIAHRFARPCNRRDWSMAKLFAIANGLHHFDRSQRAEHPLGDRSWTGDLLEVGA